MRILGLLFFVLAWTGTALAVDPTYRMKPGDLLEVLVWQEEGLQREVVVAPDGTFSFPLAGHIRARGRTAAEIERSLTRNLKEFITDPVVTVVYLGEKQREIHLYEGFIYVTGQVGSPGLHKVERPTRVLQAISQAGGLSPFAAKGRIKIIRKIKEQEVAILFDYSDVTTGRDTSTNIRLKSGDVIVVPERSIFGGLFE